MAVNVIVIFVLIGMTYWWWLQGFFSGLLHFMLVVVSGCIAFAVWEPLAHWLMGVSSFAAQFAYCLGLILPFFLCLMVTRVLFDKYVKGNLFFVPLIDGLGGGAFGAASAVLTAGIFLLGVNFSPVAKDFLSYEPVIVNSTGTGIDYSEGSSLWVPVDKMTANFFTRIGGGSMAPAFAEDNLAKAYPNLLMAAHIWRQHPDANALRIATPQAVSVDAVRVVNMSEEVGVLIPEAFKEAMGALPNGSKLLLAETTWRKTETGGTYDSGTVVRVGPNQLAVFVDGVDEAMIPPSGFVGEGYQAFASSNTVARGLGDSSGDKLAFFFVLPAQAQPEALYVRGLRFPIDQVDGNAERFIAALTATGTGGAQTPTDDSVPWLLANRRVDLQGSDGGEVEATNDLPRSVSINSIGAGDTVNGNAETGLLPGDNALFATSASSGNAIRFMRFETFFTPVRMKITPREMRTVLGRARQLTANLNPLPRLRDADNQMFDAVAFVTTTPGEGMRVYYDDANRGLPRALAQLLNGLDDETELYLYFAIRPGRHITGYSLEGNAFEPCDFYVPTPEEVEDRN